MSNRTWVCVECGKSYRRVQTIEAVSCSLCGQPCEYVHWKIHIPSPKKRKEWEAFWTEYRAEKRLLERFRTNPKLKRVSLRILNQELIKS